jgi:hypothetical protein
VSLVQLANLVNHLIGPGSGFARRDEDILILADYHYVVVVKPDPRIIHIRTVKKAMSIFDVGYGAGDLQ